MVVFSGADISGDSEGPLSAPAEGLRSRWAPTALVSPEGFARHPQRVAQWYDRPRVGVEDV